jgi:hypothetical protein
LKSYEEIMEILEAFDLTGSFGVAMSRRPPALVRRSGPLLGNRSVMLQRERCIARDGSVVTRTFASGVSGCSDVLLDQKRTPRDREDDGDVAGA